MNSSSTWYRISSVVVVELAMGTASTGIPAGSGRSASAASSAASAPGMWLINSALAVPPSGIRPSALTPTVM